MPTRRLARITRHNADYCSASGDPEWPAVCIMTDCGNGCKLVKRYSFDAATCPVIVTEMDGLGAERARLSVKQSTWRRERSDGRTRRVSSGHPGMCDAAALLPVATYK